MLDVAVAIALLVTINTIPIFLMSVIIMNRKKLHKAEITKAIGTLYDGKNVERQGHHEYLMPLAFFYRRALFICATVFLFEQPSLQMIFNQVLTMCTIAYLAADSQRFVN